MTLRKNGKVTERERQVQIALAGLRDGTYKSVDQAVAALGVSKTTLHRRARVKITGRSSRMATSIDETRREGICKMDQYVISYE